MVSSAQESRAGNEILQRFTDALVLGDCLKVLRQLPPASIDLIYADPPFFTGRWFSIGKELIFDDRWSGGLHQYLNWIYPRLVECRRVLKGTGSIYVHSDTHASHYLKMILDRIFGYENMVNEIIWQRQSAHNDGKQGARHFGRVHDTILFYSKGGEYHWNPTYLPYDERSLKSYRYIERDTGRRYAQGDLTGPGGFAKGNPFYEFLGIKRYWRYSKEKMQQLYEERRIIQSTGETVPRMKRYLDEMQGIHVQDVWTDSCVRRGKAESLYPTEKPISLLRRIILASTAKGSIVLDPFCGSGTTLLAATRLGRHWIGVDVSKAAIDVSRNRLSVVNGRPPRILTGQASR